MNMSVDRQKTIAEQRLFNYYILRNQLVCICFNEFQKSQINRFFTLNDDILDLVNHSVFDQKKIDSTIKYVLIFLYNEQNWNNKISLNDFQINKNLFVRRKQIASNDLFRYNQLFVNFEFFFQNVSSLKNEQNENVVANDDRCDKKILHEQFKRNFVNFYYRCVFE